VILRCLEACFDPPDQAGEVSALGSVEGMDLIDDEVAKGIR
jgi:hypothetical protein